MTNNASTMQVKSNWMGYFFISVAFWIVGLLVGLLFAYFYGGSFISLMREAVLQPVSIVTLFVCVFLPLFFSLFFAAIRRFLFLYFICLLKAISYGFTAALISTAFTSAGWLIRMLFLFSDTCACMLLLLLSLKICRTEQGNLRRRFWRYAVCGFAVIFIDHIYIAPFLRGLF